MNVGKRAQASVITMDDTSWNSWCDGRIVRLLGGEYKKGLEDCIAQVVAHLDDEMREHVAEEIEKLRTEFAEQLGSLRAEIEILRAHSAKADQLEGGSVTPTRARHVA